MPQYLSPGVYVEEVDSGSRPIEGVGTAVAAFIGMAKAGPLNEPTLVTNWGQFTGVFGDFLEGSYLAHAVYGYFQNGGGSCYVIRVGAGGNGNGSGGSPAPGARGELTTGADGNVVGVYQVTALEPGTAGNDITVEIADAGGENPAEDTFKLIVKRGIKQEEEFEGLTTKRGRQNAATVVNAQSKLIKLEEVGGGNLERPSKGEVHLVRRWQQRDPCIGRQRVGRRLRRGPGGADRLRRPRGHRSGHHGVRPRLDGCLSAGNARSRRRPGRAAGHDRPLRAHGRPHRHHRPAAGLNAQQIREWRLEGAGYDSKQAALYWPWVKVFDPASGKNIFVPPSRPHGRDLGPQ